MYQSTQLLLIKMFHTNTHHQYHTRLKRVNIPINVWIIKTICTNIYLNNINISLITGISLYCKVLSKLVNNNAYAFKQSDNMQLNKYNNCINTIDLMHLYIFAVTYVS
eukprot:139249_1